MPPPTGRSAPILGRKDSSRSTTDTAGKDKRTKDISDLQRRLSHLTNAIDETLLRSGGVGGAAAGGGAIHERRVSSSPMPVRPSVVTSRSSSAAATDPDAAVPTTKTFSLVSRNGAKSPKKEEKQLSPIRPGTSQGKATETNEVQASPHRKRLMSPDMAHETKEAAILKELPGRDGPISVDTRRNDSTTQSQNYQQRHDRLLEAQRYHNHTLEVVAVSPKVADTVGGDTLKRLRDEEESIKLRIAALKRIEEEKMELIAHQKRLIDLDHERHRLEDERRRNSRGRAASSSVSTTAGHSLSPQGRREDPPRRGSGGLLVAATPPPRTVVSLAPQDHGGGGATSSSLASGSGGFQYSRSPSPILHHLRSVSPSHSRGECQLEQVREAVLGSATRVGTARQTDRHNYANWVPTAKGDQRFACREFLIERGVHAKVLTGHDRSIACKVHLSPNHQELLALPLEDDGGASESHHFPLRGAALLYPNGVVQHAWLPKRVHVSGVVIGNRAKSVLLAKGCPHFVSTAREQRPRLYLVVGGDAYSDEATLLVLQFPSRMEWLCVLLGLHGAMWPDGKPPLSAGRALWMYTCHAVTQLHWEANTAKDTLWHQSRRRSRSAEPQKRLVLTPASVPSTPQQVLPSRPPAVPAQPLGNELMMVSPNASNRFAVPQPAAKSPPRFLVPAAAAVGSGPSQFVAADAVRPALMAETSHRALHEQPSFAQAGRPNSTQPQPQTMGNVPAGFVMVPAARTVNSELPARPANSRTFFPKTTNQSRRPAVLQYGY